VVEFGEWLCLDVLKKIPHRHFVFSIPKILRRYFLYDRKLLAGLSRSAWESLKVFLQDAVHENVPVPGAVIAVQTFGDFLGFNPHCHILLTDGCFYGDKGMFRVAPPLELKKLEAIFRHKVFRMLLKKGKISEEMVRMRSAWKHSGFNVFCGNRPSTSSGKA
jgi:hypothetical protein